MPEKSLETLTEVFVSNSALTGLVYKEFKKGNIRKLASRVYTKDLKTSPKLLIKRNLWQLISELFPKALISDRTALNSDRNFIGDLKLASPARAFLENMKHSRARGGLISRTLSKKEIEDKLEDLLQQRGSKELNRLRDEAKQIAHKLNLKHEYAKLNKLISTLLGTHTATLSSPRSIARVKGLPYDAVRLESFESLRKALEATPPVTRIVSPQADLAALPFFESYFSNYIEGTQFEVNEALDIIFKGKIPKNRPSDAHDILGTYEIVSDKKLMKKAPKSSAEFASQLKSFHSKIMAGRPEKNPGLFKNIPNRAGTRDFVAPELVAGTLKIGFELSRSVSTPFGRAAFMMFLITEVHPFLDGNGRAARVCMNVELESAKEYRIIIPTIYRDDYIGALKAVSIHKRSDVLIRVLDYALSSSHRATVLAPKP